jgi:carbonic anhydrase
MKNLPTPSVAVARALALLALLVGPALRAAEDHAPAGAPAAHAAADSTEPERPTPDAALQRLLDGNARFAAGHAEHPNQSVARRIEVVKAQTPFAAVITCSDSRVAPELYCDQGIGDLFVVRDAGNVLDDHVIGSVEYAVEHLHVSVIIVIGHEKCGAVSAAVAGGHADSHIASIIESLRPAVQESRNLAGDKVENAVRTNARRGAMALKGGSPIIINAMRAGEVKVFAGRYDLTSGRLELLP